MSNALTVRIFVLVLALRGRAQFHEGTEMKKGTCGQIYYAWFDFAENKALPEVCGSPNCCNSQDKNKCPYDPLEECKGKGMGSMHMTCGDVKEMYKEAMCCGNPEKQVTLGMK